MRVYIDHAATTPCDKRVVNAMLPYFTDEFGNADSQHFYGRDTAKAVADSREKIANLIGCKANELYFTGSGTEADNWALKGVALHNRSKGNHIIISSIEHHAILNSADWLENNGFRITRLPVDKTGLVSVADLEKAIDDQTTLVSIMYVNNEVGTIEPIRELAEVAHRHGALFHSDCVQAMPYMKINVKDLGVDLMSISGHKFYGPKGVGALYIRNGVKLDKLICGGGQERSQRGGTTNTPLVVGMAHALEFAVMEMEENNKRIASLRDHFVERVVREIPYVRFNGNKEHCVPSVANFSFEFVEGEGILMLMDFNGVAVSSGSACSSGSLDPSHVLLAMGVPIEVSHGSIRFSFGKDNTIDEVDYAVDTLKETIAKLREMSPLFNLTEGENIMYNQKVLDAFANPQNVGVIENADGEGTVGNATCGDIMKITLKIENNVIVDAKFQTFGCAAAIATSSTATQMVIGMTVDEALKLTNARVVEELEGLPPQKIHCSVLAEEAIKKAIEDYRAKQENKTLDKSEIEYV